MSTFDIRQDAPGMLRAESVNITIKFERTGPNTGRVSWNIPAPAVGCTADNQAYAGMLVTLDNTPVSIENTPKNGEIYNGDPTADVKLFAGDKLGTAQIIGAFYDKETTFFDVADLLPNTPYYVSGYPVDAQYRYYVEGVHAYSLGYTHRGKAGTSGTQTVVMNFHGSPKGVRPTDYTGLQEHLNYSFNIQLGANPKREQPYDVVEINQKAPVHTITLDGIDVSMYQDLVNAINVELSLLNVTAQGPVAPNTNGYYFNAQSKQLFQWNGTQHIEVPVLIQATEPNNIVDGSYWLNSTTAALALRSAGAWVAVSSITTYGTDPSNPVADQTYWFDGTKVYLWNGNTWCPVTSYMQTTDPSKSVTPPGGAYWLNTKDGILFKWDNHLEMWSATTAVQYHLDPNALPVDTYWFDETSKQLKRYASSVWNSISGASITEHEPSIPVPNKLWYNPAKQELLQRNAENTTWDHVDVVLFPIDPTLRKFCDLWLNTDSDELKVWDALNSVWLPVTRYFEQDNDPSIAPNIIPGAAWHDGTSLYVYEFNCFKPVQYINRSTNPLTGFVDGDVWNDGGSWHVRQANAWVSFAPVVSPTDPSALVPGTMWYKTTPKGLWSWNGSAWAAVTTSPKPLTPAKGSLWFDTAANVLKMWDGMTYIKGIPEATVELDANGSLLFTHTRIGSTSKVVLTDVDLFASLDHSAQYHVDHPGQDEASDVPTYALHGVGTDGNDSARLSIQTDIRYELGYPVVDVELTKEQLDYAIDRAISDLRSHSSIPYKRTYFFMPIAPETQRFYLTNKTLGLNKIVDVLGVTRVTSSFLSSAHGAGVYGQMMLQQMYSMGSFDLLSYHINAEYTKLMEMLFAARVTFSWNEQTRELFTHHRFPIGERVVCLEATVERTEQDLMTDRYAKSWIRRYAAAICRGMLADIRGKFSTLPGAGGSVTLNSAELRQMAKDEMEACMTEIEDQLADKADEYGMGATFTMG